VVLNAAGALGWWKAQQQEICFRDRLDHRRCKSQGAYEKHSGFGEMVAVLWAEKKYDAAIVLAQFWNNLGKSHAFYLRCAYPAASFTDVQPECAARAIG
jgi:hypothetical protein